MRVSAHFTSASNPQFSGRRLTEPSSSASITAWNLSLWAAVRIGPFCLGHDAQYSCNDPSHCNIDQWSSMCHRSFVGNALFLCSLCLSSFESTVYFLKSFFSIIFPSLNRNFRFTWRIIFGEFAFGRIIWSFLRCLNNPHWCTQSPDAGIYRRKRFGIRSFICWLKVNALVNASFSSYTGSDWSRKPRDGIICLLRGYL